MELRIEGLDKVIKDFDRFVKYNNVATRRALNRIGKQSSNVALRQVKEKDKWNLGITKLKKYTAPKIATNSRLIFTFKMASKSIQLQKWSGTSYFSSTTPKGKKRNAKRVGVRFRLKIDRPKATLAKSFMKKSLFGAKELIVFTRRKSPLGADITAQASITPSSMFQQTGESVFIKTFLDDFTPRYAHELHHLQIF